MSLDSNHFGDTALVCPLVAAASFRWRRDSIIAFLVGRTPFGRCSEVLKRMYEEQAVVSGFHWSPFFDFGLWRVDLIMLCFLFCVWWTEEEEEYLMYHEIGWSLLWWPKSWIVPLHLLLLPPSFLSLSEKEMIVVIRLLIKIRCYSSKIIMGELEPF